MALNKPIKKLTRIKNLNSKSENSIPNSEFISNIGEMTNGSKKQTQLGLPPMKLEKCENETQPNLRMRWVAQLLLPLLYTKLFESGCKPSSNRLCK